MHTDSIHVLAELIEQICLESFVLNDELINSFFGELHHIVEDLIYILDEYNEVIFLYLNYIWAVFVLFSHL